MFGRRKLGRLGWVMLACASAASLVSACSETFSGSDCKETRTCPRNGEAGEATAGAPPSGGSAGGSGSGETGTGLGGSHESGSAGQGEAGGPGGSPECPEGYVEWLTSGFSFPDGDVIGTADFPSHPWIKTGALAIAAGRLTGLGSATLGQGVTFSYDGIRLRFRLRFSDSGQKASVAFNGARNDAIGVYVTVDSAGKLLLAEGETVVEQVETAPLATEVDWFVEGIFEGTSAEITLGRENYGAEVQAEPVALVSAKGLKASATGVKTVVQLDGSGGLSPELDELSVARCGVSPPEYEALFVDTFERPDSVALGNAEFPATSSWTASSPKARIIGNALEVAGLALAAAPLETVPGDGLRIRTTVRGGGPGMWADVNYNSTQNPEEVIIREPGFWVWGPQSDATYTSIFQGVTSEKKHPGKPTAIGVDYFVELNRDDGSAVLTVRTGSFAGPIFVIDADSGLTAAQNTGQFVKLSTSSGISATSFKDFRVDVYSAK